MAKLTAEQVTKVKGMGFLRNRGTDLFSGRMVAPGTVFTAENFKDMAQLAETYGNGKLICTSRLAVEIPGIPFGKIDEAVAFAESHGLRFGGTGNKIRPITACKGTTCVYGNFDTQALAKKIHEDFYLGWRDVQLPHKFKIGIGGCPNSCMKPSLNDVGIEGCKRFSFDPEICRGCKKCAVAESCPSRAVSVVDGKAVIDGSKCTSCGVCVGKCPFGAVPKEAESVCRIYVGGTWGKKQRMGTLLSGTYTEAEVPDMIEKVMLWFKENAYGKERLGAAIDRLGTEKLEADLATNNLLERKEEILAKAILE